MHTVLTDAGILSPLVRLIADYIEWNRILILGNFPTLRYAPFRNEWTIAAEPWHAPYGIVSAAACVVANRFLVLTGGERPKTHAAGVECFGLDLLAPNGLVHWRPLPSLNTGNNSHTAVAIGRRVYVVGRSVEVLDGTCLFDPNQPVLSTVVDCLRAEAKMFRATDRWEALCPPHLFQAERWGE